MSAHTERDLVSQIAEHDSPRARERALAIRDPLFRAQALAWVARFAPGRDVLSIAQVALAACAAASESYQEVAAAAWPIRALIERGFVHPAEQAVTAALNRAPTIANPVSRVDALFLIWQAAYPLGSDVRGRVLELLVDTAVSTNSWKPQRVLQSLVFMLPVDERVLADEVVNRMPPGQYRRAAARRLDAGERQDPRPFFWSHAA